MVFRKAPGGVFFALLKKTASPEQLRIIFEKERECTRIRKKHYNRRKKAWNRSQLSRHGQQAHNSPSAVDQQGPIALGRSVVDNVNTEGGLYERDGEVTSMEVDNGESEGKIVVISDEGDCGDVDGRRALLEREGERTMLERESVVTLGGGKSRAVERAFLEREGIPLTPDEGERTMMEREGVVSVGEGERIDRDEVVALGEGKFERAVDKGEKTVLEWERERTKGGIVVTIGEREGAMLDSEGQGVMLNSDTVALEEGELRPTDEDEGERAMFVITGEHRQGEEGIMLEHKGAIDVVTLEREHRAAQDFEAASSVNFTSFSLPE